jgi:hypothetical protein
MSPRQGRLDIHPLLHPEHRRMAIGAMCYGLPIEEGEKLGLGLGECLRRTLRRILGRAHRGEPACKAPRAAASARASEAFA